MSSEHREPVPDEEDDLAARVAAVLKVGAPVGVVLLAIGMGVARGAPLAILVLAAGALAAVIALFWQSVRTLVGETPLSGADAFAIAAPRAEEEKKRAVLRALKDLEFEKSVGKISAADYDELVLSYRAEARSLLQQLDASAKPKRDRVLAMVDERLRLAGLPGGLDEARAREVPATEATAPSEPDPTGEDDEDGEDGKDGNLVATEDRAVDAEASGADEDPTARATCAACAASNEIDAAFCKKCGAKMASDEVTADAP